MLLAFARLDAVSIAFELAVCFVSVPCSMAVALCLCGCNFDWQRGNTALIYAAQYGRVDCVRLLIDAGADKDAKDNVRRRFVLFCGLFLLISTFLSLTSPGSLI
jgi:hypothetical protein